MRNKPKLYPSSRLVRFLNVIITILTVLFLFSAIRMISELKSAYSRDSYSSISYYLEDREYGSMIQYYFNRHYDVDPFSSQNSEYYSIADYANSAFQHRYFSSIEDAEAADHFAARMDAARGQAGSLSVITEDIDALISAIPGTEDSP